MRLSNIATLSTFVLGVVGGAFKELKIPQVEAIVEDTLARLDAYVHYKGNKSDTATISKRQGTSYWYESIAHQGISPFGPGGYAVYRNVKSFGAKGDALFHYP
jgi:glucan 1,3-beta-glucosidase